MMLLEERNGLIMKQGRLRFAVFFYTFFLSTAGTIAQTATEENWPHWRGPLLTGVAPQADPPVEWSEERNVRWKKALPGKGHSSPILWNDRVFVTAAVPFGEQLEPIYDMAPGSHDNVPVTHHYEFVVFCLDRSDGEIVWQRTLIKALPHEGGHHTGSLASNSPVTDGERIYAFFGSHGLYCLNWAGDVVWERDLGKMQSLHGHGEGSSPVLHGDVLIVNWDHEGQSFIISFNKQTGEPLWKTLRNEVTSWASPIVVEHQGKPQIIVSGTDRVRGYDLASGEVIWECGGLSANVVATPVASDGIVYAGSSYDKRAMIAIRLAGAAGDVTGTPNVLWTRSRGTPYVPSPLLYGDAVYFLTHYQGIMTRLVGPTGEEQPGAFRLPQINEVYASPVGAASRVYVTDRHGSTIVFTHESLPRMLSLNRLDDTISATPALSGKDIFLRGERFLYCLSEDKK